MKTGQIDYPFYIEETYQKVLEALKDHRISIRDNELGDAEFRIGSVTIPIPESIDAHTYLSFYTHHTIAVQLARYIDDDACGLINLDKEDYNEVMSILNGEEYEYV